MDNYAGRLDDIEDEDDSEHNDEALSSVFKTENGQSLQASKTDFLQLLVDDPDTSGDETITEVDSLRIDFRNTLDSVFDFTVKLDDGVLGPRSILRSSSVVSVQQRPSSTTER